MKCMTNGSGGDARTITRTPRAGDQVIWTPNGVWFQHENGNGDVHLSDCGKISLSSVREFCRKHSLWLTIVLSNGQTILSESP